MTEVIKRDGKKQKFYPNKIKKAVMASLRDADVPRPKRAKLVREVANPVIKTCRRRKAIRVTQIRNMVVKKLRSKCKEAATAWIKFEKKHHRKRR